MFVEIVLAIFVLTYFLLIYRKIGKWHLPIWVSMVVGAILMVATLSISPKNAFNSIDFQVIEFLFGMLVITNGFEKSGLINYIVLWILKRTRGAEEILLAVILGSGFLSAFLVNDTIALLWTPIVLGIATRIGLKNKKALLFPLAFGITIGSAFTPIGNPQNVLVTVKSGMSTPFTSFVEFLAIPTAISLVVVYYLCRSRFFFGRELRALKDTAVSTDRSVVQEPSNAISDWLLAKESAITLALFLASIGIIETFPPLASIKLAGASLDISISFLAFLWGVILLIISPKREYLLVSLSWSILIFFAGMFVVMGGVWNSGIGPRILGYLPSPGNGGSLQTTSSIMLASTVLSQILSNVPFVELYSYQMHSLGFGPSAVIPWLAVAAGSTLAGNLTILGAASNIIIIHSSEIRGEKSFSFIEFLKYGSIVTVVTVLIFTAFLSFS